MPLNYKFKNGKFYVNMHFTATKHFENLMIQVQNIYWDMRTVLLCVRMTWLSKFCNECKLHNRSIVIRERRPRQSMLRIGQLVLGALFQGVDDKPESGQTRAVLAQCYSSDRAYEEGPREVGDFCV